MIDNVSITNFNGLVKYDVPLNGRIMNSPQRRKVAKKKSDYYLCAFAVLR